MKQFLTTDLVCAHRTRGSQQRKRQKRKGQTIPAGHCKEIEHIRIAGQRDCRDQMKELSFKEDRSQLKYGVKKQNASYQSRDPEGELRQAKKINREPAQSRVERKVQ